MVVVVVRWDDDLVDEMVFLVVLVGCSEVVGVDTMLFLVVLV